MSMATIQTTIDEKLSNRTRHDRQFPLDRRMKYYTRMDFYEYNYKSAAGGFQFQQGPRLFTLILPLPVELNDLHRLKYDEKSVLPWVALSAASKTLGDAVDVLTNPIEAFAGLAPNEYQTILFDRPEFKRHELHFKLSPKNFDESTQIRDIYIALNNAMSPGLASIVGFNALFKFPWVVQVTLLPNTGWLFKFKPCVIEAVATSFAGGDRKKAFYHGNENPPESITLSVQLLETEYWINEGYKKHDPYKGGYNDSSDFAFREPFIGETINNVERFNNAVGLAPKK